MSIIKVCKYLSIAACIVFLITACTITDTYEEVKQVESKSSMSGLITLEDSSTLPVFVNLYQQQTERVELVNTTALNRDGSYQFDVLPGSYLIAAYVDQNKNHQYDPDESAIYTGYTENQVGFVDIARSQQLDVENLTIRGPIESRFTGKVVNALNKFTINIGKVVNLNDSMFSVENVSMGLWQPLTFVEKIDGGLLMLQRYDANKIPVIFVHGISGSPLNFNTIINNIDLEKFQPWVLYYPSGAPLEMVSDYFLRALNQLYAEHAFPAVQIIAHSMGGLMSRSFLIKQQTKSSYDIALFISINSPMFGMKAAASGVAYSPIVVPSWRDVASESRYIERVHEWKLPTEIPYHLIFSYLDGKDGDGLVSLSSQLSLSLQDEAVKIYGFNAEHTGILEEPELWQLINHIMENPTLSAR